MTQPAIRVEGLWKEYVIGGNETAGMTFRESVMEAVKAPLRRLTGHGAEVDKEERFWALKDVSFEVQPGEVVGIIGRNGAGKSTLLKILSRITAPTRGRIEIRGRVASLLEVGTGFHQELTGRENIRLNGAILGMSGAEIARKFDEIVAFAGVEKFIDTPVKRYSSGMQVRLAFAVAAHLDPEILIVDEVLAVGDAEFQKKCMGKMGEIAGKGGRTVLFVSHQLGAVSKLCQTGMLVRNGQVEKKATVNAVISTYVEQLRDYSMTNARSTSKSLHVSRVATVSRQGTHASEFLFDQEIVLRIEVAGAVVEPTTIISVTLVSKNGDYVTSHMKELDNKSGALARIIDVTFPASVLAPRQFTFRVALFSLAGEIFDVVEMAAPISVVDNGSPLARFAEFEYGQVVLDTKLEIREVYQ